MAAVLGALLRRCAASLDHFAEQEACARLGLMEDSLELLNTLARVGAALEIMERRRLDDPGVDAWATQVKDAVYELDDVVDLCVIEGRRLADEHPPTNKVGCSIGLFSCFKAPKFQHKIAVRIRELDNRLKELERDAAVVPGEIVPVNFAVREGAPGVCRNSPVQVGSFVAGTQIEQAAQSLIGMMLRRSKKKVELFGVVGAGGIGKTTLARKVYEDGRVIDNFPIRVWVRISKNQTETDLLKEIIRGAGADYKEAESKEELISCLNSSLSKRFLIVLDDVWKPSLWEELLKNPLGDGVARGRILITTRDISVARDMKARIHEAQKMDSDNGWEMLSKEVLEGSEEEEASTLKEVGMKIVEKCDGLPLAIKIIAGILRTKEKNKMEWEKVLYSKAWSMSRLPEDLPKALYLGYQDLPSYLKQCFLYCSLYPQEYPVDHFYLIRQWIAEGFITTHKDGLMEDFAQDSYRELIWRNLLQTNPGNLDRCWIIHDILRSLALFLIADESILVDGEQRPSISTLSRPRRASLHNMKNSLEDPVSVRQRRSLRALLLFSSPNLRAIDDALLRTACSLRVLDLSKIGIESLPSSIEDLLHLRYVNLDNTRIRDLPASVGRLVNLQTLSLRDCQSLQRLPKCIMALYQLRCLRLERTPLHYVPRGIGSLKHLNYLDGLVVGSDTNYSEGCELEELQALSELRYLHIENLERSNAGYRALANKPFLRNLHLCGQAPSEEEDEHPCEEEAILRNARIWNELSPPRSTQNLVIKHCPGLWFPSWLVTAKLGSSLPNLVYLDLDNCRSCTQLPPLGLLGQLKRLQISGAESIVSIGPEFLGHTTSGETAFPQLEVLKIKNMSNWEEWSLGAMEAADGNQEASKFLSCLKILDIQACPKLKSLPEGLRHASALQSLHIEAAYSITEIKDLPCLTDELSLKDNKGLQRISDLPALRKLVVNDCSKLKHAVNLGAVQHLSVVFPPSTETFYFEELIIFWSIDFPRWLSLLIKKHRSLRRFELRCSMPLLESCLEGGKNWHVVQQVPEVRITSSDGRAYIRYSKYRRICDTNVGLEEWHGEPNALSALP